MTTIRFYNPNRHAVELWAVSWCEEAQLFRASLLGAATEIWFHSELDRSSKVVALSAINAHYLDE